MSEVSCTACQELRENAPEFVANGVTDTVCASLAADTGLDSTNGNNDATDLHTANDCLIGRMADEINAYDVCDWKEFMKHYINNDYEINKGIICALGGLWSVLHKLIEALGGGNGSIPVIKHFKFTVPVDTFGPVWRADLAAAQSYNYTTKVWQSVTGGIVHYMSGGGYHDDQEPGEGMWIEIPVSEMDSISGVWGQTWVVPGGNSFDGSGKPYMQTVSIQQWFERNSKLIVNFDTHVTAPVRETDGSSVTQNGAPYPITVDFLVVGLKKIF